jgi:hypothetical protein
VRAFLERFPVVRADLGFDVVASEVGVSSLLDDVEPLIPGDSSSSRVGSGPSVEKSDGPELVTLGIGYDSAAARFAGLRAIPRLCTMYMTVQTRAVEPGSGEITEM